MGNKKITICRCSSRQIIDKEKVSIVSEALRKAGYLVQTEADLCEKAISSSQEMNEIASTTVIACYPRAIASLFSRLNLTLPVEQVLDIRNEGSDEILRRFNLPDGGEVKTVSDKSKPRFAVAGMPVAVGKTPSVVAGASFSAAGTEILPLQKQGQDAWYPVIDRDRCVDCGKCHDYCLFGVYVLEENQVKVKFPRNCKNNCPACARICPAKAIIFPKYAKSPINGGLTDEEQAVSIDAKSVYTQALRAKLEQRKAGIPLLNKKKI
jgi:NAD-dependent dihydropyrimidine dehydrogenase PreA subunit